MKPQLPSYATRWPEQIAAVIEQAIASSVIGPDDLAGWIVGLTPDCTALSIWPLTEYEDYPYRGEGLTVLGSFAVSEWLDEMDQLQLRNSDSQRDQRLKPRLLFADADLEQAYGARVREFYKALVHATQAAATGPLAQRFKRLVAAFITEPGSDASGYLVAFCHPDGAPLLSLREQRKEYGYSSVYPSACLTECGWTIFYPKGEEKNKSGDPVIHEHRFEEIEYYQRNQRQDGVMVRLKARPDPITYSGGHHQWVETFGGLTTAQAGEAIFQHFEKYAISKKLVPPASLEDSTALLAYAQAFDVIWPREKAILDLCDTFGLDTVHAAIQRVKFVELQPHLTLNIAKRYVKAGRAAEALKMIESLPAEHQAKALTVHAQTLFALNRFADVVKLAQSAEATKASDEFLLYEALSLGALGQSAEGLKLLEKITGSEAPVAAVRARLLVESDLQAATAAVMDLFAHCQDLPPWAEPLKTHPALSALFIERERRAGRSAESTDWPTRVVGGPAFPHLPPRRRQAILAKQHPEQKARPGAAVANDKSVWVTSRDFGIKRLSRKNLGEVLLEIPLAKDCPALDIALLDDLPIVALSDQLAWIDPDGILHRLPTWFQDDFAYVAANKRCFAAAQTNMVAVYQRNESEGMRALDRLRLGDVQIRKLAWAGDSLLVQTQNHGLIVIDASDPNRIAVKECLFFGTPQSQIDKLTLSEHWAAVREEMRWWFVKLPELEVKGYFLSEEHDIALHEEGAMLWVMLRNTLIRFDTTSGMPVPVERAFVFEKGITDRTAEFTPNWLHVERDSVSLVHDAGISQGEIAPYAINSDEIECRVQKAEPILKKEIIQKLKSLRDRPDFVPLGSVRLGWYGGHFNLKASGAQSWPTLANPRAPFLADGSIDLDKILPEDQREDFAATTDPERAGRWIPLLTDALCEEGAVRILEALANDEEVRSLGAGRLALVHEGEYADRVITHVALPGEWKPLRASNQPKMEKSLREELQQYDLWRNQDLLVSRALREYAFREELLQIAAEGNTNAISIAMKLSDVAEESVLSAVLKAAPLLSGQVLVWVAPFLKKYRDRQDVRERLEAMTQVPHRGAALAAHCVIGGRRNDPRVLQLFQEELRSDNYEIDSETLWHLMDQLNPEYLPALRDALEFRYAQAIKHHSEYEIGKSALRLFKAGRTDMPPQLMKIAGRERELERNDGLGDLFSKEGPSDALVASRLFTSGALATRLRDLAMRGNSTESVWPTPIPLEPYDESWNRFFDTAKPILEKESVWDELHRALIARLQQGTKLTDDQHIAYHLALFDIKQGDPHAEALRTAILAAPPGIFTEEILTKLKKGMAHATAASLQNELDALIKRKDVSGMILLLRQLPGLEDDVQNQVVSSSVHNLLHALLVEGKTAAGKELVLAYMSEWSKLGPMKGLAKGLETGEQYSMQESFAAKVLHLYSSTRDEALFQFAEQLIPKEVTYTGLAFNLACLYAIRKQKTKMLEMIRTGRGLGKPKANYLRDSDFEPYRNDPEFVAALEADRLSSASKQLPNQLRASALPQDRWEHHLGLLGAAKRDLNFRAALKKDLIETFGYFSDPKITGNGTPKPVARITFEWAGHVTTPPNYLAMAYGYAKDQSGCFSDCGGIDVELIMAVADAFRAEMREKKYVTQGNEMDQITDEFTDLAILAVAEVVREVMKEVIETREYQAFLKEPDLRIQVNEHDGHEYEVFSATSHTDVTAIWFRTMLDLEALGRELGLTNREFDYENVYEWITGEFEGQKLNISRRHEHALSPKNEFTLIRPDRATNANRPFDQRVRESLGRKLCALGLAPVFMGQAKLDKNEAFTVISIVHEFK